MKSEGAKKMDTKKILESLTDMGCDEKEISYMKKMYEEGDTDTFYVRLYILEIGFGLEQEL